MELKKQALIIAVFAGVLLLVPSAIRLIEHNAYASNSESYLDMRLFGSHAQAYDVLEQRDIPLNILNLINLGSGTGQDLLFYAIPIIMGFASVLLAYGILHRSSIPDGTTRIILLLMVFSPIFIYVFMGFTIYTFVIFLNLLGLYLLMSKRVVPGGIVLSIIPFIDIFSGILSLVFLSLYYVSGYNSSQRQSSYKAILIALLLAIVLSCAISAYMGFNLLYMFELSAGNFITDIGADIGFSFSILILAVIGLILLWENGLRNLVTYLLLVIFVVLSAFNETLRIYLSFILIIYAGFAFTYLNKRKWSIPIIKKTTMLLIVCSLLFSTLVYGTRLVESQPTPDMAGALSFIAKQSILGESILSLPQYGYMVEYYSGRQAFVDSMTKYYSSQRISDFDIIASSRNLAKTEALLHKYNIKYIVTDREFRSYLAEADGLQFLIDNSQKFIRIYTGSNIEVWMYVGGSAGGK